PPARRMEGGMEDKVLDKLMRRELRLRGSPAQIMALLGALLALGALTRPAAAQGGTVPPGLRTYFMFGLAAQPPNGQSGPTYDNISWLQNSGTRWDACYQYLAGGANT